MSLLKVSGLKKNFGKLAVLKGIDFELERGKALSIIGSSGSGKTTLLRCLNFLETPNAGTISIDNEVIFDASSAKTLTDAEMRTRRLRLGLVFQSFNLFPQYTVFDNLTLAPKLRLKEEELSKEDKKIRLEQIDENASNLLKRVGLTEKKDYYPCQLSGGQQQRVAIARALINKPKVLLLDEPLGALDLKLRKDMQVELKNIQSQTGITFIYVTHDQEEALSMSDTVVVMANGKIQQIGTPTDIYNEPVNAFVADFIGESNIIDGVMLEDFKVRFAKHTFVCLDKGFDKNEQIDVVIRPEDVDVVPVEKGMLTGVVSSVTFKGVHYEIIVDIDGFKWMIQTTDYVGPNEKIGVYIEPDAIHIMKKSEFSNMFGDYSSFSDEFDELSEANPEEEEE